MVYITVILFLIFSTPDTSEIKEFTSLGTDRGGYISGLNLSLTINEECKRDCLPVYYVCVKAENGAGEFSDDVCSSPIKIVRADKTGKRIAQL